MPLEIYYLRGNLRYQDMSNSESKHSQKSSISDDNEDQFYPKSSLYF